MRKLLSAVTFATALCLTLPAQAALNSYLTVGGASSGRMKGGGVTKGHEDEIEVIAVKHEIKGSTNASKAKHGVLTITKEIDASSPQLQQALATNEDLKDFRLEFYRPDNKSGKEINHYTVELTGAHVSAIELQMFDNKDPELVRFATREQVSFTYEEITWIYSDGKNKTQATTRWK